MSTCQPSICSEHTSYTSQQLPHIDTDTSYYKLPGEYFILIRSMGFMFLFQKCMHIVNGYCLPILSIYHSVWTPRGMDPKSEFQLLIAHKKKRFDENSVAHTIIEKCIQSGNCLFLLDGFIWFYGFRLYGNKLQIENSAGYSAKWTLPNGPQI